MTESRIIEIADEADISCPVCGIMILDNERVYSQPSCPHVRFIYANGEAFEYCDPHLQAVMVEEEAKADKQEELFDMWDALRRHCGPGDLILEQRSEEMACGPVEFTVWIGIRRGLEATDHAT